MSFRETEIGFIPSDWEIDTMENALEEIIDYRGKTPLKSEFGIETLSAKSVKNGYIDYSKAYFISEETYKKFMVRGFPKKGDILLTTEAPLGLVARLDREKVGIAQRLLTLRGKNDYLLNNYLMYYLMSTEGQHQLNSRESGTTVTGIKQKEFRQCLIAIPPFDEQKAIAHILSTLDEKIEVNNQINKTLEKMAQAIFKQWFVDFEFPNEDGEPYQSSGGEMVESELGLVPKGWEVVEISSLLSVKDGTHDSPKAKDTGYVLITSKHLKENRIDYSSANLISEEDYVNVNKRSKVDRYDILITMIGTVGNIYLVQDENIDFVIKNIGLFKTSENTELFEYVYMHLKSANIQQYIYERLAGSTQKYISLTELRKIPIILSSQDILKKYKNICNCIFKSIYTYSKEIRELELIRDTLLPKLMSGEIRVLQFDDEEVS